MAIDPNTKIATAGGSFVEPFVRAKDIADLATGGSPLTVKDGNGNTVANTGTLIAGAGLTVSGSSPSATITPSGGGGVPLPFVGTAPVVGWMRPSLATFDTWLNQGGSLLAVSGNVAPGTVYAPGDVSTLAGGTFTTAAKITITDTQLVSAAIVNAGTGGTPGAAQVAGTTGGPDTFLLDVTIGPDGSITSINDINQAGDYTTNPTDLSNEPVSDWSSSGITGAVVSCVMGALTATVDLGGAYTVVPTNPVAEASSTGSGTGATWDVVIPDLSTASDLTGGLPLIIQSKRPGAAVNSYLQGLLKAAPSTPYTISIGLAAITNTYGLGSDDTDLQNWALILYNSSEDKAVVLRWDSQGQVAVWHYAATSPDTAPTIMSSTKYGFAFNQYFEFLRADNDGTNLTFSLSFENELYMEIYTEASDALVSSFDKVGFGMDLGPFSQSTYEDYPLAVQNAALWQWTD
jgi:hypothetical protein